MASLKALCLAGVASLGAILGVAATAHAADLLPPLPSAPVYTPPPAVVGFSGFYLRGDVGEGNLQLRNGQSTFNPDYGYSTPANYLGNDSYGVPQYSPGSPLSQPYGFNQHYSVSPQVIIGGGVGYQFNSFFRADVTGEYRFGGHYHATEGYAAQPIQGAFYPNYNSSGQVSGYTPAYYSGGADYYSGNISNGVVLVNGYVDIGTWYRITPYVGAGVGVAFNHMSGLTDYNVSYFGQPSGSSEGHTNTQLAYAFMAGFAYDLTPHLKLDFGYRYLNMGRISSGEINCYGGTPVCGDDSREVQHYRLDSHDIRLGLRYAFAEPLIAPPVLVRKY